jgi:hypothetical protein
MELLGRETARSAVGQSAQLNDASVCTIRFARLRRGQARLLSKIFRYDRSDGQKCEQGASERDLAQRIGGELPFHERIAAGEHHGRADHVGNPERDLVAPGCRSHIRDGHRGGPIGRMSIRTPPYGDRILDRGLSRQFLPVIGIGISPQWVSSPYPHPYLQGSSRLLRQPHCSWKRE